MTKKTWIACFSCKFIDKCLSGKSRIVNVQSDSPVFEDIGCFGHEQYKNQIEPKQLKIF